MDKPTIDLASNEELIQELMNRASFLGVLVHVEHEVTTQQPPYSDTLRIMRSPRLPLLGTARMLSTAVLTTLNEIAKVK